MAATSSTLSPKLRAWYQASRPRTLTATYVPLALAGVIAVEDGVFNLWRFLVSLVAALSLQIASNLINEYADFVRGSDAQKVAGMGMVIKGNLLTPREVLSGAVVTVGVGVALGLYLLTQSGPLLLAIGVFGVLVVILYTAGPAPLAYLGLGEVAVFLSFGPLMVLGAYYVISGGQASSANQWRAILASLPIACSITNLLHANNLRDLDADRAANKRTLPARFGLRFARGEYTFWVAAGYVLLVVLVALGWIPWLSFVALATIPEARRLVHDANTLTDPLALHALQGRTGRFHRDFGAAIIFGWMAHLALVVLLRVIGSG